MMRQSDWRRLGSIGLTAMLLGSPAFAADDLPDLTLDPCPDGEEVIAAQKPEEKATQDRVEGELAMVKLDATTEVKVAVVGSVVCLQGTAASQTDSKRVEDIVSKVEGVGQVVNRLKIPIAGDRA